MWFRKKKNYELRESELLPCPFCGSVPEIKFRHYDSGSFIHVKCVSLQCSHAHIVINTFGKELKHIREHLDLWAEAIDKWNTRHPIFIKKKEHSHYHTGNCPGCIDYGKKPY